MKRYELQAKKWRAWAILFTSDSKEEIDKVYQEYATAIKDNNSPYAQLRVIEVLKGWW